MTKDARSRDQLNRRFHAQDPGARIFTCEVEVFDPSEEERRSDTFDFCYIVSGKRKLTCEGPVKAGLSPVVATIASRVFPDMKVNLESLESSAFDLTEELLDNPFPAEQVAVANDLLAKAASRHEAQALSGATPSPGISKSTRRF